MINVTSSPFLMVLDAWTTTRSPMKYLDVLFSQLWLKGVKRAMSQANRKTFTCGWEGQTLDTALCQCSWSFQISMMHDVQWKSIWSWYLFSKIGSCVSSGSGMPSTTLCVFHWTMVSVRIGYKEVETSLQSSVYHYRANLSSNRCQTLSLCHTCIVFCHSRSGKRLPKWHFFSVAVKDYYSGITSL